MQNKNTTPQKFFLYARKSTDVEDKQVLSIEAQITELRVFAKQEGLNIVEEFIEKQSAKIPGRPVFNKMLDRIERGEANGIISWHPDRLARNSVDGGKIIFLLDTGRLASLKFPQFWFEPTPQGKFMLNIAFGQSKYYVDSLSENTKRGLGCVKKLGEENIRALRQWDISTMCGQKQSRWTERKQRLSRKRLSFTPPAKQRSAIFQTFWRNTA
jgi:DNA invertase Pin-like site-specific DNA recombinase